MNLQIHSVPLKSFFEIQGWNIEKNHIEQFLKDFFNKKKLSNHSWIEIFNLFKVWAYNNNLLTDNVKI